MGDAHSPSPVLPFVAVTSRYADAIEWSLAQWAELCGAPLAQSDLLTFDQTDYYRPSMGDDLRKCLAVFAPHADPAQLVAWKLQSNRLEQRYAAEFLHPQTRPVNIDPGYVTLGKLVLASTKDHAHRIYLDRGIYAEVTLQYRGGAWQSLPAAQAANRFEIRGDFPNGNDGATF